MAEPMICIPGVDNYPEWTTFSVARWYFFQKSLAVAFLICMNIRMRGLFITRTE